MKKLGQFMKNIPALIGEGWQDLCGNLDKESDIHILGLGNIRKFFLEDEEILTTHVDGKHVSQNPDVLRVVSFQYKQNHIGMAINPGGI